MATLEHDLASGRYRVRFRYGGRQFKRSLKTQDEDKAKITLDRIEEMIALLERGLVEMPPNVDPGQFIVTDGKLVKKPVVEKVVTLSDLFDRYREMLPEGAKETSTTTTERIHFNHLKRHLGGKTVVQALTTEILQEYIVKRSQDKWRGRRIGVDTIKKEIATLCAVWNWAAHLKYLSGPAPVKGLVFPKGKEKPRFQTWDEIERVIERGGMSKDAQKELWDSLFLTVEQIVELLAHVEGKPKKPAFVYPMIAFVAYTGARRSEMMRARVEDFNLAEGRVVIREKKKDKTKQETYRHVDLAAPLVTVLKEWFGQYHPGGVYAFCRFAGRPLSRQNAAKAFRRALAKSKWQKVRGFHVFRHSFASNLAAKGIDQRLIDEWMGHQTEAMRKRYRHLFPDQRRKAIELVFSG